MSMAATMALAAALSGCGSTTYFAGRSLPPSKLTNRVLISIQNPSASSTGALEFVDAYYDIRYMYKSTNTNAQYFISGYTGNLPTTIQNMPEEQMGLVYNSGSGVLTPVNYAQEATSAAIGGLNGFSSSVFLTRNQHYAFAASQASSVLTVVDRTTGGSYALSLPDVYRVSVNPGGSVALAFVQNSDYVYYPRELTATESLSYTGGPTNWPKGAVDCEPQTQSGPVWCLFQALDPSTGKPLTFDRPVKAVFSADGGTAYVLNCGPECYGSTASVSKLSVAPMLFPTGQHSGTLPTQELLDSNTIAIPGGASNALVDSSTLYVVGQEYTGGYWGGNLTKVNLSTSKIALPAVSIGDGAPGAVSRMIMADDDTLWIGMSNCTSGVRVNNNLKPACLTMFNTSTNAVTLMPYNGNATGIAAITDLHKIYTAEGGQIYIYSTVDGTAIDNQYVTVTGTAYDVAYMDAVTDSNNTAY